LTNAIATAALALWDMPKSATLRLINLSENETYLVEGPDFKAVLRLHRIGYHSKRAIECELAWAAALNADTGIKTPHVIAGRNDALIQTITPDGLPPQHAVLFEFIEGDHPNEEQDLVSAFQNLGALAAKTHQHSTNWTRPEPFERLTWDLNSVFGPDANWGDWRNAPNVTNDIRRILERVERVIIHRFKAFGKDDSRYGLIHADMRLANLLVKDGDTRLIDFDDCGFGWYLYDFAAAISFMEDHAQIPALRTAWVQGYRAHRALSEFEEAELDSFIMLRRMALLAWIGTHMDSTEPQALAPEFARVTAELGQAYLAKM
jgi:Ser/Thr protein kinase RdoA (MazF antagonist)